MVTKQNTRVRKTAQKQPSKTLLKMINDYNRMNQAANKSLISKRDAIIKKAMKEGIFIKVN